MLGVGAAKKKTSSDHNHEEVLDIYKMLATNCKFKKPV